MGVQHTSHLSIQVIALRLTVWSGLDFPRMRRCPRCGRRLKSPVVVTWRYRRPIGSATRFRPATSSLELIWQWLREGWSYRVKHMATGGCCSTSSPMYADRTAYEMDAVRAKDFVDYFLMMSDIVRYAKSIGCPVGPARGSAAASLVCYLLRITEVDP
jgi:DNA polymerase-3 subunit alpha